MTGAVLNAKSVPETLCGCVGPLHDHVTVPPGAMVTAFGAQKKLTEPVTPTDALSGLPLDGGGVGVGGAVVGCGAGVLSTGAVVAVAGAVVAVAASAVAVGEVPAEGDAACVGEAAGEPAAFVGETAAVVAGPGGVVGVTSLPEAEPPQAASAAPASAMVMRSGRRRTTATSRVIAVLPVFWTQSRVTVKCGTKRMATASAMATRHVVDGSVLPAAGCEGHARRRDCESNGAEDKPEAVRTRGRSNSRVAGVRRQRGVRAYVDHAHHPL